MEGEEQRQPVTPHLSGWATLSVARLHSHQSLHRLHEGNASMRSWHDLQQAMPGGRHSSRPPHSPYLAGEQGWDPSGLCAQLHTFCIGPGVHRHAG